MENTYLGRLDYHDPLYDILFSHACPDVADPLFHVVNMARSGVYKYTEERSGISVIGKFFSLDDTRQDRIRRIKGEYDNLRRIRDYGFDTFPHYVVRPLAREERIGLALIEEFIGGRDLDHYFRKAAYQGGGERLKEKLSLLATFFCKLHTKTADGSGADLGSLSGYFQKVVNKLRRQGLMDDAGVKDYLRLMDKWFRRSFFRARNVILHGDATPTNFILTGNGGVVAIDLERMKPGDAAFDIGMICGELKHSFLWRTGNDLGAEPFIRHFLKRYCGHFRDGKRLFRKITLRLPFYMALTELRIARNSYLDRDYRRRLVWEAGACLRHGLRAE